ncbi:AAA family ATPase [Pseudomonas oryzihabitans]|uniref:AAA family ATPase n=1 Tax=Pseudomonas oryzihabitans TaxID=47885 RepID=UPI00135E5937|nr:AAA family ATPase [Pseudomonas oryzihabitans]
MKTVSFVNMKGGVAKTTLAVNVAHCLSARHGFRVLIIDLDPQFNATQCLITGDRYKEHVNKHLHTVVDLFDDTPRPIIGAVQGTSLNKVISFDEIVPITVRKNLSLLPGALELYRLEMSGGQGRELRLKNYVETLSKKDLFDVVIVDTPPTPSAWMSAALIASDAYLVPVRPEPLSVTGIDLLRSVISRVSSNFNLQIDCAGVVLTVAEENTRVFRESKDFVDQNSFWKGKRFQRHLPKRTAVARAQGVQNLILDMDDSELKLAVTHITSELISRVNIEGQRDDI